MKDFVILADLTCDLSRELRKDFGVVEYIPGHITIDGQEMQTRLDWDLISREDSESGADAGSGTNQINIHC